MQLTSKVLGIINDSVAIKLELAKEAKRSQGTVQRWINGNDPMLTTAGLLQVIKKATGLKQSEILTTKQTIATDPGDEVESILNA